MNSALAIYALVVGGWVYPDIDNNTPPLNDPLSQLTIVQERELNERAKTMPLPKSPSLFLLQGNPTGQDNRGYPGGYPNSGMAGYGNNGARNPNMQFDPNGNAGGLRPPTDPGNVAGNNGGNISSPNANYGVNQNSGAANYQRQNLNQVQNNDPNATNLGASRTGSVNTNPLLSGPNTGPAYYANQARNYGSYQYSAPQTYTASDQNKAFANTQVTANPISPWLALSSPLAQSTPGGAYANYVQPAFQQQQMNQQLNGQIRGAQNMQPRYGQQVMPEQPVGQGPGMAAPGMFLNYKGFYPNASGGTAPGFGQ